MKAANAAVDYTCWPGMVHGLASLAEVVDAGKGPYRSDWRCTSKSIRIESRHRYIPTTAGSNGLHGTAGSERESHNEDCIVSLPCPKRLLANYAKANAGIEVYSVLICLLDFDSPETLFLRAVANTSFISECPRPFRWKRYNTYNRRISISTQKPLFCEVRATA